MKTPAATYFLAIVFLVAACASEDESTKFVVFDCDRGGNLEVAVGRQLNDGVVGALRFPDERNALRELPIVRRGGVMTLDWGKSKPASFLGRSTPETITDFRRAAVGVPGQLIFNTADRCIERKG